MFGSSKKPARLGRWDGRRRSSRGDEPIWTHLWSREVLLKLGLVTLTVAAVALLVYFWGQPFPYRVGEQFPFDVRARVYFEVVDPVKRTSEISVVNDPQEPVVILNGQPVTPEMLERAKASISEQSDLKKISEGTVLVERKKPITEAQLTLLKEEHRAYQAKLTPTEHVQRGAGVLLILAAMGMLIVMYVARFQPVLAHSWTKIITNCLLVFTTVLAALFATLLPGFGIYLPLTIAALLLTLAYNPQFALVMSVTLALAMTVALDLSVTDLIILLSGMSTVVLMLRNVRTRTRLVKVGCCAGLVYFIMTIATGLVEQQGASLILADASRRFVWGTLAGFLLTGLLPLVERAFSIVTDISLLELADGSHPLLQELVRRAPGTYTHSITVATLAEGAADAIGANPLLVRVGSYFHDVGKMLKPHYFVENQAGENKHESLEPALSTLIIIGHVKDGMALAKQYGLPKPILDFVEQHHGTTLVEYFYREALRLQEGNGNSVNGEFEAAFRYPGPKPQNRENGILMLADAVESASRALQDPTPQRLKKLVHELLMKRLLDGQFQESNLTLTELHTIEESICKSLIALFHARIKYPEQDPAQTQPLPSERPGSLSGSGFFTALAPAVEKGRQ